MKNIPKVQATQRPPSKFFTSCHSETCKKKERWFVLLWQFTQSVIDAAYECTHCHCRVDRISAQA